MGVMVRKRAPGAGRHPVIAGPMGKTELIAIRLAPWHIDSAKRLGNGNISEGVRKALDKAQEDVAKSG